VTGPFEPQEFCPYGCYWECEHRAPGLNPARAALRPVDDEDGRPLQRCRECGDFFANAVAHSREHVRMRQLGWLPEHLPAGWYR
jgi:hypothetical protein